MAGDPIEALRQRYMWPAERPAAQPVDWSLDGGGRQLVIELIERRQASLMLEIGVFMGGSLRTWLDACPDLIVIAVDTWDGGWWGGYAREQGRPDLVAQFDREGGPYETFLATNWDYRDRIVPVRRPSPDVLHELADAGVGPDLVYLDSNKVGGELALCHELFPDVLLTGDDWAWGTDRWRDPDAGYPIRGPVRRYVAEHGLHLRTHRQTWVADPDPPGFRDRVRQALVDLRMQWRRVRGLRRALQESRWARLLRPRIAESD